MAVAANHTLQLVYSTVQLPHPAVAITYDILQHGLGIAA